MKVSPQMRSVRASFEKHSESIDAVDEKEDGFSYDRGIAKMFKAGDSSPEILDWKGMK